MKKGGNMTRKRPPLTVGKAINFLSKLDKNLPIGIAPSWVNLDEPPETQEFINWEEVRVCVAIEHTPTEVIFGWAA